MKKILKRSLALSALMAFVITGSAMAEVYELTESSWETTSIEKFKGNINAAIENHVDGQQSDIKNDGIVNISNNTSSNGKTYGVIAYNNSKINILGDNINVTAVNENSATSAVSATTYSFSIKDTSSGKNKMIQFTDGGTINIGTELTKDISIKANAKSEATGIEVMRSVNDPDRANGIFAKPSFVNIKGDTLNIDVYSDDGYATGIWAQNNTGDINNPSTITIDAKNTIINSSTGITTPDPDSGEYNNIGIVAYSSSKVIINNNLTVNAGTAISTRGGSTTLINENGAGTVKINGDINFNYDNPTSGTAVDAVVDIHLTDADSFLNGNIFVNGNPFPPAGKDEVNSMNLELSNGAQWSSDKDSFVNNLEINDGVINLKDEDEQTVTIDRLFGAGGTVNISNENNTLAITQANEAKSLTVAATSDYAEELASNDMASSAQKVANQVIDETADTSTKSAVTDVYISETAVTGAYTAKVENGLVVGGQEAVNSTNKAISEMANHNLMVWRLENNDMNKRLGELRDSKGEHGVWVRMTRGEGKYKAIKNQYNAYQLGYDEKLSTDKSWTVGAAFTYTDGETSFATGSGENKHKGFAVYGSKLNDDGSFIDLIAKYSRLDNEFKSVAGIGNGEYETNGYSVSAEYGKRFTKANGFWIEPQVELTYGKVGSASYVTSKGVLAQQDGMESLVGRIGFAAGKNFKRGNAYVRASYLYDFDGDTKVTYSNASAARSIEDDLGGGWFEVGIGSNINLSKATHLYVDIEKTYGGDVAVPWQWNAGLRYSF